MNKNTNRPSVLLITASSLLIVAGVFEHSRHSQWTQSKRSPAGMAPSLCVYVNVDGKKVQYDSVPDKYREYFNLLANPPSGSVADVLNDLDNRLDSGKIKMFHSYRFPEIDTPQGKREDYSQTAKAEDKGMICAKASKVSIAALIACLGQVDQELAVAERKPGQQFMQALAGLNALLPSGKRLDGNAFADSVMQTDKETQLPATGWMARGLEKLASLHGDCNNPTCDELYAKSVDAWSWFGAKHDLVLASEVMKFSVIDAARAQLASEFGITNPAELGVDQCFNTLEAKVAPGAHAPATGAPAHARTGGGSSASGHAVVKAAGGAGSTVTPVATPNPMQELVNKAGKLSASGAGSSSLMDALFNQTGSSVLGTIKMSCPDFFPRDATDGGGKYDPRTDPLMAKLQAGKMSAGEFSDALYNEHRGDLIADLERYYFEIESEAYFNYLFSSTPFTAHASEIQKFSESAARCHPDGAAAGAALVAKLRSELPNRDADRLAEAQLANAKKAALASVCVSSMDTRIAALRDYLGMNWNPAITPSDAVHGWIANLGEAKDQYVRDKVGSETAAAAINKVTELADSFAAGLFYATPVGKVVLAVDATVGQTPLMSFEGSGDCNFIALRTHPQTTDPTGLLERCSNSFAEFAELSREREELIQRYPVLGETSNGQPSYQTLAATLLPEIRAMAAPEGNLLSCMDRFVGEDGNVKSDPGVASVTATQASSASQADSALNTIRTELAGFCKAEQREKVVTTKVILNGEFMSSYYDCGRKRFAQAFASIGTPPDSWPSAYDSPDTCAQRRQGAFLGCKLYRESSYKQSNSDYLHSMGKHGIQSITKIVMDMLMFATPMMKFNSSMTLGKTVLAGGRGAAMGGGIAAISVGLDYGWDKAFGKPTSPEEERDRALHDFRLGYGSYDELHRTYDTLKAAGSSGSPRIKSIIEGAVTGILFEVLTHQAAGPLPTEVRAESPAVASAADLHLVRLWADLRDAGAFKGDHGPELEAAVGKTMDSRLRALYPQLNVEALAKLSTDDKVALIEQRVPAPDSTGLLPQVEASYRDPAKTFSALRKGEALTWTFNGENRGGKFIRFDPDSLVLTLDLGGGKPTAMPIEDFLGGRIDDGSLRLAGTPNLMGWNFEAPIADLTSRQNLYKRIQAHDGITVVDGEAGSAKLDGYLKTYGHPERVRIDPTTNAITLGDDATVTDLIRGIRELRLWKGSDARVRGLVDSLPKSKATDTIAAGIKKLSGQYRERTLAAAQGDDLAVQGRTQDIESARQDLKSKIEALATGTAAKEKLALALDEANSRGDRSIVDQQADLAQEQAIATKLADIQNRYSTLLASLGKDDQAYVGQIIRLLEEQGKSRQEIEKNIEETKTACGEG